MNVDSPMAHIPLERRTLLAAAAFFAAGAAWAQPAQATVRIGYQKSSTLTVVLKAQGTLERRLAPLGVKPSWHGFTSGLPLLEALNLDNLDFSADVADTVPVFAQAACAQLTFVAQEAPSPTAQAIVVRADSPLRSVGELKGKKISSAKAAGAHYLLIAALEQAGQWVMGSPDAAATLRAPIWGVDVPAVLQANGRRSYAVRAAVPAGLTEQQKMR